MRNRWLVTAVVLAGCTALAGDDAFTIAWKKRVELARKKLTGTDLDACDRGLETAYAESELMTAGKKKNVMLWIKVGDQSTKLMFTGEGRYESFMLGELSPKWKLRQTANSKTITLLTETCAMDVCGSDPTLDGACPTK